MVTPSTQRITGYRKGERCEIEIEPITERHYLEKNAARAFRAMREAAAAEGITLIVNSAFRDSKRQTELHEMYQMKLRQWQANGGAKPAPAARPGWSNHQSGLAVDVNRAHDNGRTDAWLDANADRFGFRRTVASEPWHFEFFAEVSSDAA